MTYKLHGAILSPYVRKCRAYFLEKQIPFESIHVDPGNIPSDYEKLNPLMRIPALEHGDLRLADSSVICQYIEKLHPTPALFPTDAGDFAQALWLEKYADYELGPLCTFGVFRERLIKPLRGLTSDESRVEKALEKLPPLFDYLNELLDGREWFVGDQISIADIAVASQWVNFQHGGEQIDAARWPHLAAHRDRVHTRPSFAESLAQEHALIGKIRHKLGLPPITPP